MAKNQVDINFLTLKFSIPNLFTANHLQQLSLEKVVKEKLTF